MLELPTSLSPSRVEKFLSCPLAFRFATVEKLPERPSIHTTRGSLVHRALELAYARPAAERTPDAFRAALAVATHEFRAAPRRRRPRPRRRAAGDARRGVRASSSSATCAWRTRRPCGRSGSSCGCPHRSAALELRGVIDRLDLTRRRRARRRRLQDRPGPVAVVGAAQPVRRAVLRVPVRAGARPPTGRGPPAVPGHRRGHRGARRRRSRRASSRRGRRPSGRPSRSPCAPTTSGPARARCAPGAASRRWCPAFGGDPDRAAVEAPPRCRAHARRDGRRRDRRRRRAPPSPARPAPRRRRARPLGVRAGDRPLRPLGRHRPRAGARQPRRRHA